MERATGSAPRFFCICYNTIFYYADVELSANKKCYNMKQTIHKFLLLAVMAIVGITNAEAYTCCIDGIYYNVDKTKKTAEVTYKSGGSPTPEYRGSVVIPESITYNGVEYPVTSIMYNAFENCSGLTSITIPSSVTNIDYNVFSGCNNLQEVHISDVKAWCKITFGNNDGNPLYYAKHLYINGNEVKDLVIPDGVTSMGILLLMVVKV